MIPAMGHWAVNYLVGKLGALKKHEMITFIIGGILPDVDLLLTGAVGGIMGEEDLSGYEQVAETFHRTYTHSLLVWAVIALIALIIIRKYAIVLFGGVTFHLFLDTLDTHGVPPLYPLVKECIHFDLWPYKTVEYIASPLFAIELGITLFAVFLLLFTRKR